MCRLVERIEEGDFVKVFSLFFIVIFALAYAGVSCTQPGSSLGSVSENNRDDNDDEDRDNDRRSSRRCDERDSCQDICDDLFNYTTERSVCYDLTDSEVDTISRVADEFYHNRISLEELEDLDSDSVSDYLEIGFDSFVDLVSGEPVGKDAKDDEDPQWKGKEEENSKELLKWIAENKDVAEVILEQDRNFILGMELFISLTPSTDPGLTGNHILTRGSSDDSCGGGDAGITITINSGSDVRCGGDKLFDLSYFSSKDEDAPQFLQGFVEEDLSSSDRFMTFSADERNKTAFEWGHKTLLEFCKEATDENEDDVEVKTCLQTVYCIYREEEYTGSGGVPDQGFEGIFDELKDHDDIVGQTDEEYCEDLGDEDEMENLFD